jgi:predicted peptidase
VSATLLGLLCAGPSLPLAAQARQGPGVTETALALEDGGEIRYAIALPAGQAGPGAALPPLVLALHPGGRDVYYGGWFMRTVVEPALRGWGAVIIAPDVPDESWATERSERAVLALLDEVLAKHAVDRSRILITGFSMGGRGTWYLAARHPDRFTAAIVMATGPGQGSLEGLAAMPIYVIHSPDDEVVPYEPVEELVVTLAARGYRMQMMRLPGASHGMMGDYVGPLQAAGDWVQQQWRETGGSD